MADVDLDKIERGLKEHLDKIAAGNLSKDELVRAVLDRPRLPGLEGLTAVVEEAIRVVKNDPVYKDAALQCDWDQFRMELSDSRMWYVAGCGHMTPALKEVLRYAQAHVRECQKT